MATATVVFTDNEDGGVKMKAIFDPGLEKGNRPTKAQQIVLVMCHEAGEMVSSALYGDEPEVQ